MPDPCEILESSGAATSTVSYGLGAALTDTAAAVTALVGGVAVILASAGVAAAALTGDIEHNLYAAAAATDTLYSSNVTSVALAAGGNLTDRVEQSIAGFISDSAAASAVVTFDTHSLLTDAARGSDALAFVLSAQYSVLGTASDAVAMGFSSALSATAAASDALELIVTRNISLSASAAATDSVAIVAAPTVNLSSRGVAAAVVAHQLVATNNLVSRGVVYDFIVEDLTGAGLWMNTETTAGARWPSYPFSSMAVKGEYLLGVGDAGLYVIDSGDKDAGADINASVLTGLTDFGDPAKKVMDGMIVAGSSAAKLDVTIFSAQGDYTYRTHLASAPEARNNRAQLGRGFSSVYYGFEFANRDGADFTVDVARLELGATKRKR